MNCILMGSQQGVQSKTHRVISPFFSFFYNVNPWERTDPIPISSFRVPDSHPEKFVEKFVEKKSTNEV